MRQDCWDLLQLEVNLFNAVTPDWEIYPIATVSLHDTGAEPEPGVTNTIIIDLEVFKSYC